MHLDGALGPLILDSFGVIRYRSPDRGEP